MTAGIVMGGARNLTVCNSEETIRQWGCGPPPTSSEAFRKKCGAVHSNRRQALLHTLCSLCISCLLLPFPCSCIDPHCHLFLVVFIDFHSFPVIHFSHAFSVAPYLGSSASCPGQNSHSLCVERYAKLQYALPDQVCRHISHGAQYRDFYDL